MEKLKPEIQLESKPAVTIALYIGEEVLNVLDDLVIRQNIKLAKEYDNNKPIPLKGKTFEPFRKKIQRQLNDHEIDAAEANKLIKEAVNPPRLKRPKKASRRTVIEAALIDYLKAQQ